MGAADYRRYTDPLFVVPLFLTLAMLPRWSLYFDIVPKVAVLLLGTAWLLLIAHRGLAGLEMLSGVKPGRAMLVGFSLQALSLIVSAAWSDDRTMSFLGTGWRRLGALEHSALLVFSLLAAAEIRTDRSRLTTVLRAFSLSCLLASAYGIAQYLGWDPLVDASVTSASAGAWSFIRPASTLGHATYFANYLSFSIFVCAGVAAGDGSRTWRMTAATGGYAGAAALFLTGTRAGLLGATAGGIFLLVRVRPAITRKRTIAIAAIAATAAALAVSPIAEGVRGRMSLWLRDTKGGPRLLLWRDTLAMSAAHPVAGIGLERFAAVFPKYESLALAQAYPDAYHESAHNAVLDALGGQGPVGALVLLGLFALGLWASFHWDGDLGIARALGAGLIALFISQQFTVFVLPTVFLFYLTVGMLVAGCGAGRADASRGAWPRLVSGASMPLAALFLAVTLRIVEIDGRWAGIQQSLAEGQVRSALAAYPGLAAKFPAESGSDLWYSRTLLRSATATEDSQLQRAIWNQALAAAARAVTTSEDRANAWYNLAVMRIQQEDVAGARVALDGAVSSAPRWYKPHWLLAEVLLGAGQAQEAAVEVRNAILLGGQRPELEELKRRAANGDTKQ